MNSIPGPSVKPDILIVDDTLNNLELLSKMLRTWGYKARPVVSGALALKAARSKRPDLILLDINMPEMNGYELCALLKADETLKDIPVLFISALKETADKVKAFECGGADYVTKPFQRDEIHARIQVHLELHQQRKRLQESYDKLRELESLRDGLVHMVVHDMNSPITVISGILEMLRDAPAGKLDEEKTALIEIAQGNSRKLADMISQLLAVSRLEAGEMPLNKSVRNLARIIHEAVQPLVVTSGDRMFKIEAQPGIDVLCDYGIVQRIIENLAGNALKFTPKNGNVKITLLRNNNEARVEVSDNGPGIPREFHQRIFEKFAQVDSKDTKRFGAGLGLAFCRLAVEAHGGQIGIESEVGQGSLFWFTLPLAEMTQDEIAFQEQQKD